MSGEIRHDESTIDVTLYVQVTIPVTLAYDDELPAPEFLRRDALLNFLDHPAIRDRNFVADLDGYVDSIGNGYMDLMNVATATLEGKCGS